MTDNTPSTQERSAPDHPTAPVQGDSSSGGVVRTLLYVVLFAMLALALGAGAQWFWRHRATQIDAGPEKLSGAHILVIDSGKVAASMLKAANDEPALAPLKTQPAALGSLVGRGIRQAAQSYAAKGYLVIDSSAVLGAPEAQDITGPVTKTVMGDAQAAAALMASSTTAPATAETAQPAQVPDAQAVSGQANARLP